MILPSDETELSTKGMPDDENSLSTKESFTGKIGVNIADLDKYNKNSLINIWKDANAYYSSGEEWTDEDAEFFDELAVRINTATEESTVSDTAVGMTANNHYDKEKLEEAFIKTLGEGEIAEEAEYQGKKVTLNKPSRNTDGKSKFKVYVKDGDKVKKVTFGDPNMEIKRDSDSRRKSFRARHNCADKKDKTKAGYWSCKMWQKGKSVSDVTSGESKANEDSPCWDGYEQIGMKEKDGKQVPNCVPKSTEGEFDYRNNEDEKAIKDEGLNGDNGLGFGQHNESFNEEDHPRDESGQFTSGSGSNSGSSDSEPKKDDPIWSDFKPDEPKINSSKKDYDRDIKIYKEKMTKYKKDLNLKQKMDKQIKDSDNRIIKILDYGKFGSRDHEKLTDSFNNNRSKGEKKITNSQMNNVIEKLKKLDIIKMGTYKKSNPWGFSTEERYELSKGYNILRQGVTEPEKPKMKNGESLDQILLNENYIQDQFGVFYRPVYVGENYKEHPTDLVFEGKLYTTEGVGNCPFCKGAGKITVEKLGLKECPDCDGSGDIQEQSKIQEHYDDEGTFWFTTDNGRRIGVKKGQTLEDALNASGIPDDGVDQSDVTGADLAKNEDLDVKGVDEPLDYDDYDDLNKDQMNMEMNRYFDDFDYDIIKSQFNSDKPMASPEIDGNRMKLGSKNNIMSDQLAGQNGEIKDQAMYDYFEGGKGDQIIKDKLGSEYSLQVEGDDVYIVKDHSVKEETGDIVSAGLDDYGMGLVEGEDYEITEWGNISYIGGFTGMLENQGFNKVNNVELAKLISMDEDTDVTYEDFQKDSEQAIHDYLNEKQNQNTYNYSSSIDNDINYGFIKTDDGRTLISLSEHQGGDIRGNYSENVLYDITGFDNGASGDPATDIGALLDPRIFAQVRGADGEDYDVTFGGDSENEWSDGEQPEGLDDWDLLDAFDKYKNKSGESKAVEIAVNENGLCKYCDAGNHKGHHMRTGDQECVYKNCKCDWKDSKYSSESCGCKVKAIEANISKYEKFINTEINVLKTRAKAGEAVGLMYGLPTVRKNGKKIKGTLAYAGVSLNDRIYLPEELAKGHGKTLPLLLNHSSTAGAEEELDRLDSEMLDHLENEKDYQVGEVTLTWDPEKLTLFYEGVIENDFFQKEVDDMNMAVSLGIFYDSNSPKVCDEECYTLIKGAEFREVSLVYHAGFPIATIEAVESKLKRASIKNIKATEEFDKVLDDTHIDTSPSDNNYIPPSVELDIEGESIAEEDEDKLANGSIVDVEEKPTGKPEIIDINEDKPITVESLHTPNSFSVRGVSGMVISNSNGVEKYAFDPTHNYSTNTIHFSVTEQGGTIFGEEMQLTPKMTTPNELTKEIESKPDIKFTDSDEDILKKN